MYYLTLHGVLKTWKLQLDRVEIDSYIFLVVMILAGCPLTGNAQEKKDSTQTERIISKVGKNKLVKRLMSAITRDVPVQPRAFNVKSEDYYLPYAGKIIRHIYVRRIGFESNIVDTARNIQTFVSKAANAIHSNTREFVIRDNLFIEEGKPLNPYRVADNERLLRNLNFVMDSRILVRTIAKTKDSVDLMVITRDVFSLGGSISPQSFTKYRVSIQDINVGGLAQRVQLGALYDINRRPQFGYELLYQKVNVVGSFIDATAGISKINGGTSIGSENETGLFFRLNRPLIHPFARWAGGLEVSTNNSANVFGRPDSLFANYRYSIQDYWVGYSFGHNRRPVNSRENRNRRFISVRGFQQFFNNVPTVELTQPDRYALRNRVTLLTQLTFFHQDYYKTQYVVGFGRTEDIPYGYNVSFTAGWEKEMGIERPYLGTDLYYNDIRSSGTILTYMFKFGSFWKQTRAEDGLISFKFSRYSKLSQTARFKIRHQTEAGYGRIINQQVKRGIDIRDINGISGFSPDSLVGTQRITLSQETVVFSPWSLLGFRLAPVFRVDLALINQRPELLRSENFFSGFSAGIRARNENLIFNTIEARVFYYPRTVEGLNSVNFNVSVNLKIKYPTNLVSPPSTVYNQP